MICSVRQLDTESQAVRLLFGTDDDGMTNGNIEKPTVRITPTTATALASKARLDRRRLAKTMMPNTSAGTKPPMNRPQSHAVRQRRSATLLRYLKPTGRKKSANQHEKHRQVHAGERRGIDERPCGEQYPAGDHQPGLIAFPVRL